MANAPQKHAEASRASANAALRADVASEVEQASTLVVIVNYSTGKCVVDCLRSLMPELRGFPRARITVVDNCSPDDSAEAIAAAIEREGWADRVELLRSAVNGGFAFGNNAAVRPALTTGDPPRFYWLLNPDTEVRPGALRTLVEFLARNPRVGIAGGSLEEANGELWPYAFRFPSLWSELDNGLRFGPVSRLLANKTVARRMSDANERVDWLPGASMMVRREVFESIGLMDDGYFLYFEETDFCLAAARAGWECWYVPASRILHIAGQSTGVTATNTIPPRLPGYWFESRRRYFTKNHGRLHAALTDLVWILAFSLWRVRLRLSRKADPDPPRYLADFIAHSALVNGGVPSSTMAEATTSRSPG